MGEFVPAKIATWCIKLKLKKLGHFNTPINQLISNMLKQLSIRLLLSFFLLSLLFSSCSKDYDVIIKNGTVYDGSGNPPLYTDIGIKGDVIDTLGDLSQLSSKKIIDAQDMAVAPGFINMLSWAPNSLITDGKGESDIRQGVTLEVFGEGTSMGPSNQQLVKEEEDYQEKKISWTTLGGYFDFMEQNGISPNIASFVGATTLRINAVGYEDRAPNAEELKLMKKLTKEAMEDGAMGIGSSLIYAPAFYAKTEELIEISKVAGEYGGMYISHMRSEGNRFLESIDELIRISKEGGLPAEIYHLKASGAENWHKLDLAVAKIDSARAAGLKITTDMYTYTAGSTGLDAAMPPWVQEGGYDEWAKRLQDPAIRAKLEIEMTTPTNEWENLLYAAGTPEKCLLVGFKNDSLKYLTGKTLGEVAKMRGTSPSATAMDLVWQDGSRVQVVYFLMSEENVKKQLTLPYMSFGSDAGALATNEPFTNSSTHPRAYGNFARVLGKYVREEKVMPLKEAIRKLSSLPASNLKLKNRGSIKPNYFADIVIFDPNTIADHATFDDPHQYSTGMVHVFVNGVQVLKNGNHTGATPGRAIRGPGWVGHKPSNQ
jgi:N-acyl-D-amino-acid deacylase